MKMKTLSSVKTGRRGDTDQTHRAGGHGEPAKKLPCIQRGASLYWCGTSVRPAGGRHYGVCKNKEAAADLSRQIKTKLADKYYYAMTDGVPEKKKGTLEDELLQNGKTNTSKVVERGTPQANMPAFPMRWSSRMENMPFCVSNLIPDATIRSGCSLHMQGCRSLGIKSTTSKKTLHRRADSLHCALLRSRSGIRKRIENWSLKLTSLLVYHKINPKV